MRAKLSPEYLLKLPLHKRCATPQKQTYIMAQSELKKRITSHADQ